MIKKILSVSITTYGEVNYLLALILPNMGTLPEVATQSLFFSIKPGNVSSVRPGFPLSPCYFRILS